MIRAQHAAHNPKFEKDGIIQTTPVVAINRLKDALTCLKVDTTLEPPTPNPTPIPQPPPTKRAQHAAHNPKFEKMGHPQ